MIWGFFCPDVTVGCVFTFRFLRLHRCFLYKRGEVSCNSLALVYLLHRSFGLTLIPLCSLYHVEAAFFVSFSTITSGFCSRCRPHHLAGPFYHSFHQLLAGYRASRSEDSHWSLHMLARSRGVVLVASWRLLWGCGPRYSL